MLYIALVRSGHKDTNFTLEDLLQDKLDAQNRLGAVRHTSTPSRPEDHDDNAEAEMIDLFDKTTLSGKIPDKYLSDKDFFQPLDRPKDPVLRDIFQMTLVLRKTRRKEI